MKRLILFVLMSISVNIILAQSVCNVVITSSFESKCVLTDQKDNLIDELPNNILACKESTVIYTASINAGVGIGIQTLTWTIIGANSYTVNSNNTVTVYWGNNSTGQVTAEVTAEDGTTCTATKNVVLIEKPVIGSTTTPDYTVINGQKVIRVCVGEDVSFTDASTTANSDISGYYWNSPYGIVSTKDYKIENVQQGVQVTHRIYNNCGCYDEEEYEVEIIKGNPLELSCYGTVCEGATVTYEALNASCSQYNWQIEGGQIIAGQGTSKVTVIWNNPQNGYGTIGLDGSACGGNYCPKLMNVKIPIITNNVEISGQQTACMGEAVIYSVPMYGSTEYNWTITPTAGVYKSVQNGANEELFQFNTAGTYQLTVTYRCDFLDCGLFTSQTKTIVVKPRIEISGKEKICLTNAANLTLTPSVSATWRVYNIANNTLVYTTTGTTFNHTFAVAGKYKVTAENSNYCNVAEFLMEVKTPPLAPTVADMDPNNPTTACPNTSILLKGTPSSTNYNFIWEPVCSGVTPESTSGNEVTINYPTTITSNCYNVNVFNYDKQLGCRSTTPMIVSVNQFTLAPINIPNSTPVTGGVSIKACQGTTIDLSNNEIPNQNGVDYEWKIEPTQQSAASIIGSEISNNVKILINNSTITNFYITLKRTYCNNIKDYFNLYISTTAAAPLTVNVTPNPVCLNDNINISATSSSPLIANNLHWTVNGNRKYDGVTSFNYPITETTSPIIAVKYNPYNYCNNTSMFISGSAPAITINTVNASDLVYDGSSHTISVVSPDVSVNTYSWEYNNQIIPGATGSTLSTTTTGDGTYCCKISNSNCSETLCITIPNSGTQESCNVLTVTNFNTDVCEHDIEFSVSGLPTLLTATWGVTPSDGVTIATVNNTTRDITFNYVGTYNIYVNAQNGSTCYSGQTQTTINYILDCEIQKRCNRIEVIDKSQYLTGRTTPIIVEIYQGSTLVNTFNIAVGATAAISPTLAANGTYTVKFKYLTCTIYRNVTFDNMPTNTSLSLTTANTASPYNTCDNTPILLTAKLMSGSTDISSTITQTAWSFGDASSVSYPGNSVQHTYQTGVYPNNTATITYTNGCTLSANIFITSKGNPFDAGSLYLYNNTNVCPGSARQINYTYSTIQTTIANYLWNNTPPTVTNNTYNTYYTGDYPLLVSNANYCREEASINVPFLNKPIASISASSNKYCKKDEVELFGDNGAAVGTISYTWTVTAPDGSAVAVNPSVTAANITFDAEQSGIYTADLYVVDVSSGCSDNATMAIEVNPIPHAPSIGFGANRCIDNPPVNLRTISSSVANKVYWNTGIFSSIADYYNAGIATAYYYDLTTGCKSDLAQIEIVSAPDFDGLLTGCYQRCNTHLHPLTNISAYGLTRNATIDWQWLLNGNSLTTGTGNYTFTPLLLPLSGFGDYTLNVNYAAGICNVSSPTLSIEQISDCPCEDVDVKYQYKAPIIQECKIIYTVALTVCNNGTNTDCFEDLSSMLNHNGIEILNVSNPNPTVAPGNCTTITVEFELTNPLLTQISFTLHDSCNECYKDFSIDIKLPINCNNKMILQTLDVNTALSSGYTAYVKFLFDLVDPTDNVLSFWSEPPQVVNYYYDNSSNTVTDFNMFDIAKLTQMAANGEDVCFYAIVCKNNILCKLVYCIPAKDLLQKISQYITIKTNKDEADNAKESKSPYLVPNPATTSVKVEGLKDDKVTEMLLMDISGKNIKNVQESDVMNIKDIEKGTYIVRVRSKANKIYYLKLIKN